MPSNSPLIEKLCRLWPRERWDGTTVVVGCSGGADSTALVRSLVECKPSTSTVVVAHFNHRLRGFESDADESFVVELGKQCGLTEVVVARAQTVDPGFDEAHLRNVRYDFLQSVAGRLGARYVAVAHTSDDSVETTLLNLCRGTGLKGLSGIPAFRPLGADLVLARPLIDVWRNEILEYLDSLGQTFRIDSSNASHRYTRNRIRHKLMPAIEEEFGSSAKPSILRASRLANEARLYCERKAERWLDSATLRCSPTYIELQIQHTTSEDWPIVQAALAQLWRRQAWPLQAMTNEHWRLMHDALDQAATGSTRTDLPGMIRWEQADNRWHFTKQDRPCT